MAAISSSGGWVKLYVLTNVSTNNLKITTQHPGGRLNKKDGLTRYGDSHVKDKTS